MPRLSVPLTTQTVRRIRLVTKYRHQKASLMLSPQRGRMLGYHLNSFNTLSKSFNTLITAQRFPWSLILTAKLQQTPWKWHANWRRT
jgi:hypothetical protein